MKLPKIPLFKNPNGSVSRTLDVLVKDATGKVHKSSFSPNFSHHAKSQTDNMRVICPHNFYTGRTECFPEGHLKLH